MKNLVSAILEFLKGFIALLAMFLVIAAVVHNCSRKPEVAPYDAATAAILADVNYDEGVKQVCRLLQGVTIRGVDSFAPTQVAMNDYDALRAYAMGLETGILQFEHFGCNQ